MALPFSFASELAPPLNPGNRHGPFEYGGNLYGVFQDTTNIHVEVWKSTDDGDSWSEADSANHKTFSTVPPGRYLDVVQDRVNSNILHILYSVTSTTSRIVVSQFNMATDAWGATTGLSGPVLNSSTITGNAVVFLAVRSDGDYVVLYNGLTESSMGTAYRRARLIRHEGSTWTEVGIIENDVIAEHRDARAIEMDAADRAYLFYTNTTLSDLRVKTYNSSNALNIAAGTAGTDIDASANVGIYSASHPAWIDTTTDQIVIPYVDSTGDLNLAYADVGDTPSWSTTAITATNDPEYTNSNPASLALDGTTIYAFWPDDTDQDIYRDSGTTAGGFGTDTEWKDAITCNGISIGKITDAVGVLYFDGTTVKYDKHTLVAANTDPRRPVKHTSVNNRGRLKPGRMIQTRGAARVSAEDASTFAKPGRVLIGPDPIARRYVQQPRIGIRQREFVAPPPDRLAPSQLASVNNRGRIHGGQIIQTKGAARISAEDASTFARPYLHVTVNNAGRIRTGRTRILDGARRIGVGDPRTFPGYLTHDPDHQRRIRQALLIQTAGASRVSAEDASTFARPSLLVHDPDPKRRRIPGRITQTLGAHQAVGVADERTFPALVIGSRNHGRRGTVLQLLGGRREGAAPPPEEITRPLHVIADNDHARRIRAALLVLTRGAARTSPSDPRTRPVVIAHDPDARRRWHGGKIIQTLGAQQAVGTGDDRTWALWLSQDRDPKRRLHGGRVIQTLGSQQATGIADERTWPALVLASRNHGRPGLIVRTQGGRVTSATDPRTWPVTLIRGDERRRGGSIRLAWTTKDEPVADTGRTRPVLHVMPPDRRIVRRSSVYLPHTAWVGIVPSASFLAGAPSTAFDAGAPTNANLNAGAPANTFTAGAPATANYLAGEPDYTIS